MPPIGWCPITKGFCFLKASKLRLVGQEDTICYCICLGLMPRGRHISLTSLVVPLLAVCVLCIHLELQIRLSMVLGSWPILDK